MNTFIAYSFVGYLVSFALLQQVVGSMSGARKNPLGTFANEPFIGLLLKITGAFVMVTGILYVQSGIISVASFPALRLCGVAVTWLGLALSASAQYQLGSFWVSGAALHKDHRLIKTGLYARVRHPLYSGIFVSFAGFSLSTLHQGIALGCGLYALSFVPRTFREEKLLSTRFSGQWPGWVKKTGMFFPPIR